MRKSSPFRISLCLFHFYSLVFHQTSAKLKAYKPDLRRRFHTRLRKAISPKTKKKKNPTILIELQKF